jgi:hypothetical protein
VADGPQEGRGVGKPVEQGARDVIGSVPGQDPQHLPGQRLRSEPIQRDMPDPGYGPLGVAALSGGTVHGGWVAN